jgi:hypothetical protein
VTGIVFVLRYHGQDHGVGATGDYRADPACGIAAAARLHDSLSDFAAQATL